MPGILRKVLTHVNGEWYKPGVSRKALTTAEAAWAVGVTRTTIQNWIASGKIRPPEPTFRGARGVRLWTESDIARLREAKKRVYGKRPGRPRKVRK